jgi:phage tail-like protein
MARSVSDDFLHSMRFQVVTDDGGGRPSLAPDGRPEAGFARCTTPEATVEAMEYKEGTFIYTRKYPGNPTMADLSMGRGVARRDASFWNWVRIIMEGSGEYRQNLLIKHFHREEALTRGVGDAAGAVNITNFPVDAAPARTYKVFQAFPIRHKVAADLDATDAAISIMEIDFAFEYFEIEEAAA